MILIANYLFTNYYKINNFDFSEREVFVDLLIKNKKYLYNINFGLFGMKHGLVFLFVTILILTN